MGLRQSKKDKTRLKLLEVALELFGRQGFEATTINEIAAAVEVSSRTLLRYFPTKEDIIVSWVEESMSTFLTSVQNRVSREPAHIALIASARELLDIYGLRKDFYLSLERAIAASPQISARKHEMTSILAEEISLIIKSNTSDNSHDKNLNILILPNVIFSILRVVITQWARSNGETDLQEDFTKAINFVRFSQISDHY